MREPSPDWAVNFSGHESFPLRYSWLSKGFEKVCKKPNFFGQDDAMVHLGVGKNMVSSIRHWGLATQVWQEEDGTRAKNLEPTPFGIKLLEDWDPYLEHPGTYWALHWNIVVNPSKATTWGITFNRPSARFAQDQLLQELLEFAASHPGRKASPASLKRDIEVFKRSYLQPLKKKGVFQEDELDCPFKHLGLLRPTAQKGEFELVVGSRPSLPHEVFEYALLGHIHHEPGQEPKVVTVEDLLYGLNSPGRVFRFSEAALMDRLHGLADAYSNRYLIDETIGLRQFIVLPEAPDQLTALGSYYSRLSEPVHA